MLDAHTAASVGCAHVGQVTVSVARLDTVAGTYVQGSQNHLTKNDAQNYEWQVIDGGPQTLASATGVLCDLSLVPLF